MSGSRPNAAKERDVIQDNVKKLLFIERSFKVVHAHIKDKEEPTRLTQWTELKELELFALSAALTLNPWLNDELRNNHFHPTFREIITLNNPVNFQYMGRLKHEFPALYTMLDAECIRSGDYVKFVTTPLDNQKLAALNQCLKNNVVAEILHREFITFNDLLSWDSNKLIALSRFAHHLLAGKITLEEAFDKSHLSDEQINQYLGIRVTNSAQLFPELNSRDRNALAIFKPIHLNKFFNNNPRIFDNLEAVLKLTDQERFKLSNMASHLYSLFFIHGALELKQILKLSPPQIRFIEAAQKNHDQWIKITDGTFLRSEKNEHNDPILLDESTPLIYGAHNFGSEMHGRLKQYINKIAAMHDNYQQGFSIFFRESRAANREANYKLALALQAQLELLGGPEGKDASEADIQTIFSKQNIQLFRPAFQHDHGINSPALKSILKDAEKHINQEFKAAARRLK